MATPRNDLTLTLTPGEQIVFRKVLRDYHAERRAAFAKQVTPVLHGTPKPSLAASQQCAIVLSLIESCRQKLEDDSWSTTDAL
jgi:hypothetical protein